LSSVTGLMSEGGRSLEAVTGLMNEGVERLCDTLARIAKEGRDVNIWRQFGALTCSAAWLLQAYSQCSQLCSFARPWRVWLQMWLLAALLDVALQKGWCPCSIPLFGYLTRGGKESTGLCTACTCTMAGIDSLRCMNDEEAVLLWCSACHNGCCGHLLCLCMLQVT